MQPRRSGALCLLCVVAFLLAFCGESRAAQEWHEFPAGRWSPLSVPGGKAGFTLLDAQVTGVNFTNTLPEEIGATNRTLYNGSGVATGDFDGDGLADVVFAGLQNKLELYKNLGSWRFTNVTARSGITLSNTLCRGVVLADVTGDGALDLLLSTSGTGVRIWVNDGKGYFRETTQQAGTASSFSSFTLALADVDGNGTVDLYVANNRTEDIRDLGQVQLRMIGGKPSVPPALTNRLVFIDGQLQEYGEPDLLLLNDGAGRFRRVSWINGNFLDEDGNSLKRAPLDWGLSATFRDLNDDGWPDLYVCNDFWTPDRIWFNDGTGHFRAAPMLSFRMISGSSMGVDMAYLENDLRPDIFVVDMLSRSLSWRKRQMASQPNTLNLPGRIADRPQSLRNTFFHARSDNTYAEMANYSGLAASEWSWQPLFIDVDLDGRLDLIVTSGHAHDVQDRDAERQVQARQRNYGAITNAVERRRIFSADLLANMRLYPALQTPIVAFRNTGELRFEDVTDLWGTGQNAIHHGIATADFDGDGDLDLAVNNLNSGAGIYRNNAPENRVAIQLKGNPPNTQGIGASVTLHNGRRPVQKQEVVSGGRYLSSSDPVLVFAAGAEPMWLEVRWRNGTTQVVRDIHGNRLYQIREMAGKAQEPSPVKAVRTLFSDASNNLSHSHFEALFDDFQRQPLLPWRLSQLGPGVTCADWDGDGWDDIVVGTGAGGRLGVYRNDQHGRFIRMTNGCFGQLLPRDTGGLLVLPVQSGSNSVVSALASYEDGRTNGAALLSFQEGMPGFRPLIPDLPSSAGPLAAADIDGDGELELFVGARVQPARWPRAGGSRILRRAGAGWVVDSENSQILNSTQCVSSAIWTDLDGDSFPELVLVGEFGPIRIFHNERGRLKIWDPPIRGEGEYSGITRFSELTGLWLSISAGDFDGDGQLDLIAGNWGENGEEKAGPGSPLTVFAGELDTPGLALVETGYLATNALTPVRSLDELGAVLPFLRGKFRSYREYSEAPIEQLLDLSRFQKSTAATLKTVLLLNRGGFFAVRPLPLEAQLAPVFGISVADFDLDGKEDVFLAQNFFATRPGVPRLDAGRGLLLRGQGNGSMEPMPGDESGVIVYGEQRGTAVCDLDRDGRPDLVVTQNGAATRVFRNECVRAGFRLRLSGAGGNPQAFGAVIRLQDGQQLGPAREVHAGSGYLSQDASVITLPMPSARSVHLEVRWPNGQRTRHPISPGPGQEVTLSP